MLKDNLVMLRNIHGYSQEEIAEKLDISRQAYSRWEKGTTIPDIEKCSQLANIYGTTLDRLVSTTTAEGVGEIPPAPAGKNYWGSVTMDGSGRIVIPEGARELFELSDGSRLIVLGDEEGIALLPAEAFEEKMKKAMEMFHRD